MGHESLIVAAARGGNLGPMPLSKLFTDDDVTVKPERRRASKASFLVQSSHYVSLVIILL